MNILRRLAGIILKYFVGDLSKRDIGIMFRDEDGKDTHSLIVIPDPIVQQILATMKTGDFAHLPQAIFNSLYKDGYELVLLSIPTDGQGKPRTQSLGAIGTRLLYEEICKEP